MGCGARRLGLPGTLQAEVYEFAGRHVVDDVMNGYYATIFAYGQTGSGKTHSMEGPGGGEEQEGIIPRAVKQIFDHVEAAPEDIEFSISVSYVEIYMGKGERRRRGSRHRPLSSCTDPPAPAPALVPSPHRAHPRPAGQDTPAEQPGGPSGHPARSVCGWGDRDARLLGCPAAEDPGNRQQDPGHLGNRCAAPPSSPLPCPVDPSGARLPSLSPARQPPLPLTPPLAAPHTKA